MQNKPEQDNNDILAKIKDSGLFIRLATDKEQKEECAYNECKKSVAFEMEGLLICADHAQSLFKCFIPETDKSEK